MIGRGFPINHNPDTDTEHLVDRSVTQDKLDQGYDIIVDETYSVGSTTRSNFFDPEGYNRIEVEFILNNISSDFTDKNLEFRISSDGSTWEISGYRSNLAAGSGSEYVCTSQLVEAGAANTFKIYAMFYIDTPNVAGQHVVNGISIYWGATAGEIVSDNMSGIIGGTGTINGVQLRESGAGNLGSGRIIIRGIRSAS